jgi:hypothetical protein
LYQGTTSVLKPALRKRSAPKGAVRFGFERARL